MPDDTEVIVNPLPDAPVDTASLPAGDAQSAIMDINQRQRDLATKQQEAITGMQQAGKEMETAQAEQSAAVAPERERFLKMLGHQLPQKLVLEPYTEPPNVRQQDAAKFQEFFAPMLIFSLLLGKTMKADNIDGLNMLSSGLRGFQEGRNAYATHMIEQWKAKSDQVSRENARRINDYNAIINDRSLRMDEQKLRLELVAAQYGDTIMQAKLKQGNWAEVLKALGTANLQQSKYDMVAQKYYHDLQMQSRHEDVIKERQADRNERARQFDERLEAKGDADNAKLQEKVIATYNDAVQKWLAAGKAGVQKIMMFPYQQGDNEWAQRAVRALANDMAGEMAFYNARLRSRGYAVPATSEALEDPTTVQRLLTAGPSQVANPGLLAPPKAIVAPPGVQAPAKPSGGSVNNPPAPPAVLQFDEQGNPVQ